MEILHNFIFYIILHNFRDFFIKCAYRTIKIIHAYTFLRTCFYLVWDISYYVFNYLVISRLFCLIYKYGAFQIYYLSRIFNTWNILFLYFKVSQGSFITFLVNSSRTLRKMWAQQLLHVFCICWLSLVDNLFNIPCSY